MKHFIYMMFAALALSVMSCANAQTNGSTQAQSTSLPEPLQQVLSSIPNESIISVMVINDSAFLKSLGFEVGTQSLTPPTYQDKVHPYIMNERFGGSYFDDNPNKRDLYYPIFNEIRNSLNGENLILVRTSIPNCEDFMAVAVKDSVKFLNSIKKMLTTSNGRIPTMSGIGETGPVKILNITEVREASVDDSAEPDPYTIDTRAYNRRLDEIDFNDPRIQIVPLQWYLNIVLYNNNLYLFDHWDVKNIIDFLYSDDSSNKENSLANDAQFVGKLVGKDSPIKIVSYDKAKKEWIGGTAIPTFAGKHSCLFIDTTSGNKSVNNETTKAMQLFLVNPEYNESHEYYKQYTPWRDGVWQGDFWGNFYFGNPANKGDLERTIMED